jgi:hypothetical protein
MTIWERVAAALAGLGVPVGANVLIANPLPDEFVVYQLISDPPAQHADDVETLTRYRVQVTVHSRDGLAGLPNVRAAMLAAGFTRGPSRELPYSESTRHYSLAQDYFYLDGQE